MMTYNKVVNVVKVISNLIRSKFSKCSTHDQIAAGSIGNLVGYVLGHVELTIIPTELKALRMQIDIIALCMGQEISFVRVSGQIVSAQWGTRKWWRRELTCALDERHGS